jgi:hypothetical protein
MLYRRRSICCCRWTSTQSCPKLPTLSAPLRHCFPAMQRHHHREHLPISVLSTFVSAGCSKFHLASMKTILSPSRCCVYCCSNNTFCRRNMYTSRWVRTLNTNHASSSSSSYLASRRNVGGYRRLLLALRENTSTCFCHGELSLLFQATPWSHLPTTLLTIIRS